MRNTMIGNSEEATEVTKVIKTEEDYETALTVIESLLDLDPAPGTPDADRLELLTLLVEDYESRAAPPTLPDPIEAIRFRMDQQGLKQSDLVPYIGSRSKVSEVLSGKRALTLSMIRRLHDGLGIPARVLLQDRQESEADLVDSGVEWDRFPLAEMVSRGWIAGPLTRVRDRAEEVLRDFFHSAGKFSANAVLYRKTTHIRSAKKMDPYALAAWSGRVATRALASPPLTPYEPGSVDIDFMRDVARLSWSEQGPLLACEFLSTHGIAVVIEPHLPRTHLDGAAILLDVGRPVIGLTLRYDRLDNFWFCLMHELAHLALHLSDPKENEPSRFFDDLDQGAPHDQRESEADSKAGEALIPEEEWSKSPASQLRTPDAVEHLAKKLRVHPAIVAGRIRHRRGSYRVLSDLVGQGQVRRLFPELRWSNVA
jgi:HTH-type transcriptional regulator/antitoxin HigA